MKSGDFVRQGAQYGGPPTGYGDGSGRNYYAFFRYHTTRRRDGHRAQGARRVGSGLSELDLVGDGAAADPDLVRQIHLDYIRAGADVIIANNYAVVPKLARESMMDRLEALTRTARRLAGKARDEGGRSGVRGRARCRLSTRPTVPTWLAARRSSSKRICGSRESWRMKSIWPSPRR
jgi:hypothetical protein